MPIEELTTEDIARFRRWIVENDRLAVQAAKDMVAAKEKATLYRALLTMNGHEPEPTTSLKTAVPTASSPVPDNADRARALRGLTMQQAAAQVLRWHGPRMHGKDLLEKLTGYGFQVGGAVAMQTLSASIRKAPSLITKVHGLLNTWELA